MTRNSGLTKPATLAIKQPDMPMEGAPEHLILARMVESLREQRAIARQIAGARAADDAVTHLGHRLLTVINLIESSQAEMARAMLLYQRAAIEASFAARGDGVKH